jgi:aminoglycoside 3-N-acetyltransferase I
MSVTYTLLRCGDLALLRALNEVYAVAFNDTASYRSKPPSDAYLNDLLESRDVIALVARDDEKVVGGLTAYVLRKPEQERSEVYLYDLAVLAEHRRRGIARSLIGELQRIGRERGAWVVFVQADPGDDPAIALYASMGTREDVHHFDLPVEAHTKRG